MADKEVRVKIIGDTSDLKNKLNALKKDLKDLAMIYLTIILIVQKTSIIKKQKKFLKNC